MSAATDTQVTLLEQAIRYAKAGLELFPVSPADKSPLVTNGFKDATSDMAQVQRWWKRDNPDALIGCRIPADMIVLDIDPRHGGHATWDALVAAHGNVQIGRQHHSGRGDGGRHIWFKHPGGNLTMKALHQWARDNGTGHKAGKNGWASGIDLLHHDYRYTILPPSLHPETQRPYQWDNKGQPYDPPGWLSALLVVAPVLATPKSPTLRIADRDSIADWFSATSNWNDILGASGAGWVLVEGDGDSDGSKWRHPTATAANSCSIKHGCLFVYSPNTDFNETSFNDTNGYTRFRAWSVLEFDNDGTAAAIAALELRDGPRARSAAKPSVSVVHEAVEPDTAWSDPLPLITEQDPAPFPVHVLPEWISRHALSQADSIQAPVDLTCVLGLGAVSVATLGRIKVHYSWDNWTQPCSLYTVVAVAPSVGKSPAKNAMFRPLEEYETERMDEARKARRAHQDKIDVVANKITSHKKAMVKDDSMVAVGLLESYSADLHDLEAQMPPNGRLMADDATIEALGMVLADCGGSIAVVSAEGGLFDRLAGLYNENGVNLDLYLEGWSGGKYTVDRVKRESISIPHANVAVVTTVQPQTIDDIGAKKVFAARGLVARFLLSMPHCDIGYRNRKRQVRIDKAAEARYAVELSEIARFYSDNETVFELDDNACEAFSDWDQATEYRLQPDGDLTHLPEWVGKLRANVLRLAAILHVAHHRNGNSIGVDSVGEAIEVADYFTRHMLMISERWGADATVSQAEILLRWIGRNGEPEFTIRDAYRHNRRLFETAEDIVPPLQLLTDSGWIRPLSDGPVTVGRGGKPSPRFAVNPAVAPVAPVSPGGGESEQCPSGTKRGINTPYLSISDDSPPPPPGDTGATGATGLSDPQPDVETSAPLSVVEETDKYNGW